MLQQKRYQDQGKYVSDKLFFLLFFPLASPALRVAAWTSCLFLQDHLERRNTIGTNAYTVPSFPHIKVFVQWEEARGLMQTGPRPD